MKTKKQQNTIKSIDTNPYSIHICRNTITYANISVPKTHQDVFQWMFRIVKTTGSISDVQVADEEFIRRVNEFKNNNSTERILLSFCDFLLSIPTNDKFLIIPVLIGTEDLTLALQCSQYVHQINDRPHPFALKEDGVQNYYKIAEFGSKQVSIGEVDKAKRVCRFCGKSQPEVTFKKKAHAIAQNIGNTKVYNYEECDICNEGFSMIEQSFFSSIAILFFLYQPKGKKGFRSHKGKNLTIDNDPDSREGVKVKLDINQSSGFMDNNFEFTIEVPEFKYIPQNIYKCLVKFALSVIDKECLPRYTKAIEWINTKSFEQYLPPIWISNSTWHAEPHIAIYYNKNDNARLPQLFVKFLTANLSYVYLIPLSYDDNIEIEYFETLLNNWFDENYFRRDLSSINEEMVPHNFSIQREEGSEVVELSRSQFESLSEEERLKAYPNASAFYII